MRLGTRTGLILLSVCVALGLAVQGCKQPEVRHSWVEEKVTLTSASESAVMHVRITIGTDRMPVSTIGTLALIGPKKAPDPAVFTVVRDSDGKTLSVSGYDDGTLNFKQRFTPFDTCGPDPCSDEFTITIRLAGADVGAVICHVEMETRFPDHASAAAGPDVELLDQQ